MVHRTDATGADGVREDEGAGEAGRARDQGRHGDEPRRAGDPGRRRARPGHRGLRPERVELAQPGRGLDDPGEAHLLAGEGEPGEDGEGDQPSPGAEALDESRPQQRARRVGAGVAEHRLLARGRGRAAEGTLPAPRRPTSRRPATARRAAPPRPAGGLERPAGPQVEEVDEVGGAGDHRPTDQGPERTGRARAIRLALPTSPPVDEHCRGQAADGEAEDLGAAGGQPSVSQRAQVAAQPLARRVAREVVDAAEQARRCRGEGWSGTGEDRAGARPQDVGRPLEEGDLLARVVGAHERHPPPLGQGGAQPVCRPGARGRQTGRQHRTEPAHGAVCEGSGGNAAVTPLRRPYCPA